MRSNNIRRILLSSSALVVGCVIAGSVSAQSLGGTGGRGFFPGAVPAPGEGGVGGGFGVVGQAGGNLAGGGGGGAGAAGGAGYSGSVAGGTGGTSGTLTAPAGAPGSDGSSNENGGGGGGGGGNGVLIQSGGTFSTTSSFAGGFGGSGGTALGGGGGGGSGGYGIAAITGPTAITVNLGQAGSVTGGEGGAGGSGLILAGGNGGDGGVGAYFAAPAAQLNLISGTISGGTGGTGGTGGAAEGTYPGGTGGRGGVGVLGSGLTIVNRGSILGGNGGAVITANNKTPSITGRGGIGVAGSNLTIDNAGGTIAGGLAGDGVTRAYAVELTGGANTVGAGGTINGGINVTGGSLMPALVGSTVGTPLMINGPLTFANGTQYLVRLTPTANDSAVVTGTAKLTGASVFVQAGDGTYVVGKRTILTATTLATKFAGVSSNLAFLSPTLSYDATNVFLTIQAGSTGYSSAALTQNQFNFAFGLTNAANMNGGTAAILQAFNQLTVTQARAAFDSVSGEGVTATQNLAFRSAELFTAAIFDQTTFYGSGGTGNSVTLTAPQPGFFAYSPKVDAPRSPIHELADLPNRALAPEMPAFAPTRTWRAWGSGFGGIDDIHGNSTIGSAEQNNDIYGGAIGVDYQVTPNYLAGIAVGGSDGEFSVPGRTTSGSTTGGHIAFYDIATFGSFYGASSNSFSYFTNRTSRTTGGFGGLGSETDRASFDSHEFRTRLEFGRHFDGYGGTITPFVALELAELRSNGFNESAVSGPGSLALNVSGQSSASVPAFVGARFQRVTTLGNGVTFSPTLQVAYIHEFAPQRTQIGTLVDLPGSTFLVNGARPSRDAGQVKFGGQLALNAHSFLFANFDGEFSGVDQFYGGHGGFKYVW